MAINVVTNPVDDTEMTIISGVVGRFSFKEKQDQFGNTHQAGIQVDGQWVNMKLKVKEGFEPQIRFAEGKGPSAKWMTLDVGDEVKMVVKPNVWNGTTSYNVTSSNIKLVKKGNGAPPQAQASSSGGKPVASGNSAGEWDTTGTEVGHAVNCTTQLLGSALWDASSEEILEMSKRVHTFTVKLKEEYGKNHPQMKKKDVGFAAGRAFKMYCTEGADLDDVYQAALKVLNEVDGKLTVFVRNGGKEAPKESPAPKASAKPAVKAPAKAVQELDSDLDDSGDDGFNDDLAPF